MSDINDDGWQWEFVGWLYNGNNGKVYQVLLRRDDIIRSCERLAAIVPQLFPCVSFLPFLVSNACTEVETAREEIDRRSEDDDHRLPQVREMVFEYIGTSDWRGDRNKNHVSSRSMWLFFHD